MYDIRQAGVAEYAGIVASRVMWGAAIEGTARELLAEVEIEPSAAEGRRKYACKDAVNFLIDLLADGPLPAKEVRDAAYAHGHSWATVKRAKKDAAVKVAKEGMKGPWVWSLNSYDRRCSPPAEDTHTSSLSTFEEAERLRQPSAELGDVVEMET